MKRNSIYVGVDQTGAVNSNGNPKPLPCAILYSIHKKWFLSYDYLENFNFISYYKLLERNVPNAVLPDKNKKTSELHLIIDSVLGLPGDISYPDFNYLISLASQTPGFGRSIASQFYKNIFSQSKLLQIPERKSDKLLKAQSVFKEIPFQKNIQTGTFRFWKEMGLDQGWFYIPYLKNQNSKVSNTYIQKLKTKVPVYEGYATLYWKNLLNLKTRKATEFYKHIKQTFPHIKIIRKSMDPNHLDAATLCLAGYQYLPFQYPAKKFLKHEGWILGLELKD